MRALQGEDLVERERESFSSSSSLSSSSSSIATAAMPSGILGEGLGSLATEGRYGRNQVDVAMGAWMRCWMMD